MKQRTIKRKVSIEDIGLHFGNSVKMTLSPDIENSGITFFIDQARKKFYKLSPFEIFDTMLATKLGNSDCFVSTIEHLLSVLHACYITNIQITICGNEIPILDGSAKNIYDLIQASGIIEQHSNVDIFKIEKNISIIENESYIKAYPYNGFKIHYVFEKENKFIGNKEYTFNSFNDFYRDICPARTFGKFEDIEKMKSMGLIKGGNLNNAVVYTDNEILNLEGLRFEDEFIRHKILDFIGDIYCLGPIFGYFEIKNSGHYLNNKFCRLCLS